METPANSTLLVLQKALAEIEDKKDIRDKNVIGMLKNEILKLKEQKRLEDNIILELARKIKKEHKK